MVSKRLKQLGINVAKEGQGLYVENHEVLLKEVKGKANRNYPTFLNLHGSSLPVELHI